MCPSRRNLAIRIDRLLHREGEFSGWQADQVLAAIEATLEERVDDGERIVMKAERPDLWEPAGYVASERNDAAQLISLLEKAAAN